MHKRKLVDLCADVRPWNFVFKNHQNISVTKFGSQMKRSHAFLHQTLQ